MQEIVIIEFQKEDLYDLNNFIKDNEWPFHTKSLSTVDLELDYFVKNAKTLVAKRNNHILGFIKINDFEDGANPLFDIRISESARGKALGERLIKEATRIVFAELPSTIRFEATTRVDNLPMISLFKKLGWTQEATYRKGWKVDQGQYLDALGYSILREEWEALI